MHFRFGNLEINNGVAVNSYPIMEESHIAQASSTGKEIIINLEV